ncbi:MAG TPA: ABC transporter substrate-binding protein [Methylomirabilota bacterium]|nr:ABC transporter substrate-binding protein [Methylomirabilota bacterium]
MTMGSALRQCLTSFVALALTLVIGATPVPAQTRVKFALDWQIQGPQAPFISAKAMGAFASQGLEVTIDRGSGSQKTIEQVATGTYDMGYGDINSMIEYNVKNPQQPLIAVYIILNTPPFALLSLKRYGIAKPGDLKGASIGAPAGDAPRRLWPIFAKNAGVPVDSVTWTNMAPPLREPALVKGDVKAISGFFFTGYLNLTENLKVPESEVVAFKYSDYGIDLYGNAVVVRADWLKKNEPTVRKFLAALTQGFRVALKDPETAIAHIKTAEPLANEATELKRLRLAITANMVNDEVRRNGLGAIDAARMQRAIDQVVQAFELPAKPTVEQVFSGAYLPPAAVRRLD